MKHKANIDNHLPACWLSREDTSVCGREPFPLALPGAVQLPQRGAHNREGSIIIKTSFADV